MATVVTGISFDPKVKAKLDYYAEQQGVTRSRLTNIAVATFLGIPYEPKPEDEDASGDQ